MAKDDNTNDDDILMHADELLGTSSKDEEKNEKKEERSSTSLKKSLLQASSKFHIPAVVREKYPKLIILILQTESMDDKEREYWFQILPIMTPEQVSKFRKILINEKEQLAKLDAEYEESLKKINDKHLSEWKAFEAKQKLEEIEKAEKKAQSKEKNLEEELLDKLQNL